MTTKTPKPTKPTDLDNLIAAGIELVKAEADDKSAVKTLVEFKCTVFSNETFISTCLSDYFKYPEGSARDVFFNKMCPNCQLRLPARQLQSDAAERAKKATSAIMRIARKQAKLFMQTTSTETLAAA